VAADAGATPSMERLDQMSWEDFSVTWNTDVKGALYWIQAALNLPMGPGGRILLSSSGAALNGSPMSGGYAGAKRMVWHMAAYANGISEQKGLGILFQAVVPTQMIGGTGVGDAGSTAYAHARGVSREAFLASFGAPMPPRLFRVERVCASGAELVAQDATSSYRVDFLQRGGELSVCFSMPAASVEAAIGREHCRGKSFTVFTRAAM